MRAAVTADTTPTESPLGAEVYASEARRFGPTIMPLRPCLRWAVLEDHVAPVPVRVLGPRRSSRVLVTHPGSTMRPWTVAAPWVLVLVRIGRDERWVDSNRVLTKGAEAMAEKTIDVITLEASAGSDSADRLAVVAVADASGATRVKLMRLGASGAQLGHPLLIETPAALDRLARVLGQCASWMRGARLRDGDDSEIGYAGVGKQRRSR